MSLNCGTALTGAKFTSQNAAIAQTAFAGGSVRYPNKFFLSGKDSSKFFEHLYFAWSCKRRVRGNAGYIALHGLFLSQRLASQAVVANADATIRQAMAQLRFEIAMIVLGECCSGLVLCHLSLFSEGENKPADLKLPAACPQKSGCVDKGLAPTYMDHVCPFIDTTWCQSRDSSMIWPERTKTDRDQLKMLKVDHLRYDLHRLCPQKCSCTSCVGDSLVCPSKEHATNKGKTVWYMHAVNYGNLAGIPPAKVIEPLKFRTQNLTALDAGNR